MSRPGNKVDDETIICKTKKWECLMEYFIYSLKLTMWKCVPKTFVTPVMLLGERLHGEHVLAVYGVQDLYTLILPPHVDPSSHIDVPSWKEKTLKTLSLLPKSMCLTLELTSNYIRIVMEDTCNPFALVLTRWTSLGCRTYGHAYAPHVRPLPCKSACRPEKKLKLGVG